MATGSKTKDMSTSIMHSKTLICGWSVIDRGWVGLKNNGLFPLSLAIWVRASPLNEKNCPRGCFLIHLSKTCALHFS